MTFRHLEIVPQICQVTTLMFDEIFQTGLQNQLLFLLHFPQGKGNLCRIRDFSSEEIKKLIVKLFFQLPPGPWYTQRSTNSFPQSWRITEFACHFYHRFHRISFKKCEHFAVIFWQQNRRIAVTLEFVELNKIFHREYFFETRTRHTWRSDISE